MRPLQSGAATQTQASFIYLNEEDRRGEDECHGPGRQHRLLGPAQGAEVLRLQGVHDGVVSVWVRDINY